MLGGEVVGAVDGVVAVGAQDGAVFHAEHEASPLLQGAPTMSAAAAAPNPILSLSGRSMHRTLQTSQSGAATFAAASESSFVTPQVFVTS